jgi:hypothetical protein
MAIEILIVLKKGNRTYCANLSTLNITEFHDMHTFNLQYGGIPLFNLHKITQKYSENKNKHLTILWFQWYYPLLHK